MLNRLRGFRPSYRAGAFGVVIVLFVVIEIARENSIISNEEWSQHMSRRYVLRGSGDCNNMGHVAGLDECSIAALVQFQSSLSLICPLSLLEIDRSVACHLPRSCFLQTSNSYHAFRCTIGGCVLHRQNALPNHCGHTLNQVRYHLISSLL